MKELSIEQKAERYDEALKWMENVYPTLSHEQQMEAEVFFPIFKESEDERIRKALIDGFIVMKESKNCGKTFSNHNIPVVDILAWLEKQCEQGPADKVEPKFKVGNWYQCVKDFFGKGVTFDKNTAYYCAKEGCLQDEYGCHIAIVKGLYDNFKLWTIQDAKDGDVLACESGWTCIFKTLVNNENFSSYCFMDKTKWFCETGSECHTLNKEFTKAYNGEIKPATKEQRDTLEKAIADAGYEWNAEKKELKKIEQKPAWSEEDEQMFEHIIEKATLKFSEWNCLKNDEINFLKSLHPQNKQEWTQDDIDMIDWLIRCCEKEHEELCNDRYGHQDIVSDLKRDCRKKWDWLESLKERVAPQSHWKPSEGQLECLGNAIDKAEKDYPTSD